MSWVRCQHSSDSGLGRLGGNLIQRPQENVEVVLW